MPEPVSRTNIHVAILATILGIFASAITIWQFFSSNDDDIKKLVISKHSALKNNGIVMLM